jgi:hypothetical protein
MTNSPGFRLYDDLSWTCCRHSPLAQYQRLAELFHDLRLHGGRMPARR